MIIKYAEIFCCKNVSSFCSAKATHIFSAKNIRILYIESAKTVNEMTLNELIKLTTLWTAGPWNKWLDISCIRYYLWLQIQESWAWIPAWHITFVEIDHEIISVVILPLPLIQEGHLSVTRELSLPKKKCEYVNVWLDMTLSALTGP